jgi:hypothetical protein
MATKNNLPPVWRFDFGDYSALGPVFQKFLSNLNLFTLAVYNILNGGVGFANLQRSIYTTTITASTTTTISFVNPLAVVPSGVAVVQVLLASSPSTAITSTVTAANWTYDGRTITVQNVTGLTSGTSYQISLEVM